MQFIFILMFAFVYFKDIAIYILTFFLFVITNTYILYNLTYINYSIVLKMLNIHHKNKHRELLWGFSLITTLALILIFTYYCIFRMLIPAVDILISNFDFNFIRDTLMYKAIIPLHDFCNRWGVSIDIPQYYIKFTNYLYCNFIDILYFIPNLIHLCLIACITIIVSVILVKDKFQWFDRLQKFVGIDCIRPYKDRIINFAIYFHESMQNWFIGELITCTLLTIYYLVILYCAKIKLFFILAIIFGFGSFVPYILDIIGYSLALLDICLFGEFEFIRVAVILSLIHIGHIFGSYLLLPMFMGSHTKIYPLQIMIGFIIYSKLFSSIGVIFNIIISLLLNSLIFGFFSGKRNEKLNE